MQRPPRFLHLRPWFHAAGECVLACAASLALVAGALAADGGGDVETDVCVVGGGSGGVSAALAAARAGARVVLVERMAQLGGTSTSAYVSSWEPGPGDSFAREIYERLRRINGAGITSHNNPGHKLGPFGFWLVTPEVDYEQTLHRADADYEKCHGVAFDPAKMSRVMAEMLAETGRCRVLLNTRFVSAGSDGDRVRAITAQPADGAAFRIRAKVFIDATGNVDLCRAVGCETMVGAEPKARFGEPSAPDEASRALNSISLCYRIHRSEHPAAPPEPAAPVKWFPHSAHVTAVPGTDDLIVNPLGVLPGEVLLSLGYEKAYEACKPIVQAHWRWLHANPQFTDYEFRDLAPALGIRESYRVVGEYVLTQRDLTGAADAPRHADIIAMADHAMDIHGSARAGMLVQVHAPYGVPFRCLVPKGQANLLVACRGASFSHIAASSCRLSRTIIALGHAAGLAAAQAARNGVPVSRVNVAAIQKELQLSATAAKPK
jgi:FAD dependent oxidoreductase